MSHPASVRIIVPLALLALACARPRSSPPPPIGALAPAESVYADLRDLRDQLDVAAAAGRTPANDARPFGLFVTIHNELRRSVTRRLTGIDSSSLGPEDARAYGIMRGTLQRDIDSLPPPVKSPVATPHPQAPDCAYSVAQVSTTAFGLDSLRKRVYACYGWSQSHVVVQDDTLDRLSVLALLGQVENEDLRRQLFFALEPVWRTVNRDNGPESPYRRLIASGEFRFRQR